jgi:tetratricopeptide (TPR) repeat protein
MKAITINNISLSVICFVLCMMIYLLTLAPTVTGEDSGEFIAAAYGWGVAHPSGYPLWTLLAGLFIRLIPIGSVAWKANLLSAVLASLAAGVLARLLQRFFSIPALISILGSICFACGNHLWSQAVITEVYTLQILLTCLILYCFLAWYESGNLHYLYWTALCFGLGLTNHHLTILLTPALFGFVLLYKPRTFLSIKVWGICMICLGLGLLPYLYLPLASSHHPYMNWGSPDTWQSFLDHVFRRQYSDDSMHQPHTLSRFWEHSKTLWHWNTEQYTWIAVPFMLLGLGTYLRNKSTRPLILLMLGIFLMNTAVLGEILNFSFDRQELFCFRVFVLPAYIISAVWLITGCQTIKIGCEKLFPTKPIGYILSVASICIITTATIWINFPKNNMRHYYYAEDHANNILNSLETNAIIIPSGDHNTFPLIYLHYVQKVRPDILIADKYGYIEYDLYQSMPNAPQRISTLQQRDEIEAYIIKTSNRPVYYMIQPRLDFLPDYAIASQGMLFRIYPANQDKPNLPTPHYRYRNIDGKASIQDHAASVILSEYYFSLAANALRANNTASALAYAEKTAQLSEGLKEEINNLGTLMAEFNQVQQAIKYFEKAATLDKQYLTPRWNLASLFKADGDLLHAIQVFNDLATLNPEDFRIYGELGFLLYQYGELELAIKNWGKSLSLNPNQPQILSFFQKINDLAVEPKSKEMKVNNNSSPLFSE